jgi:hypothetical protein
MSLFSRLQGLFQIRRLERDVDEELRSHIEMLAADNAAAAKHNLNVVGYWVSDTAPASDDTFIWVVAHGSREEAKKNWVAMFADPEFQEMVKSEQAEKLVGKVDVMYMRPTDFSPMN